MVIVTFWSSSCKTMSSGMNSLILITFVNLVLLSLEISIFTGISISIEFIYSSSSAVPITIISVGS